MFSSVLSNVRLAEKTRNGSPKWTVELAKRYKERNHLCLSAILTEMCGVDFGVGVAAVSWKDEDSVRPAYGVFPVYMLQKFSKYVVPFDEDLIVCIDGDEHRDVAICSGSDPKRQHLTKVTRRVGGVLARLFYLLMTGSQSSCYLSDFSYNEPSKYEASWDKATAFLVDATGVEGKDLQERLTDVGFQHLMSPSLSKVVKDPSIICEYESPKILAASDDGNRTCHGQWGLKC